MLVLATTQIDKNDPIFIGLYAGFPQCFSETESDGPFPLSIIRSLAAERGHLEGYTTGADFPEEYEVLEELGVPYISFEIVAMGELRRMYESWPLFPLTLEEVQERGLKQGDEYEWSGRTLIVLECNCNPEANDWWRIHLAPKECLALDL